MSLFFGYEEKISVNNSNAQSITRVSRRLTLGGDIHMRLSSIKNVATANDLGDVVTNKVLEQRFLINYMRLTWQITHEIDVINSDIEALLLDSGTVVLAPGTLNGLIVHIRMMLSV